MMNDFKKYGLDSFASIGGLEQFEHRSRRRLGWFERAGREEHPGSRQCLRGSDLTLDEAGR